MTVRPAKTQISLGIRPVWSVFADRMKIAWVLSYPLSTKTLIRLGPGWSETSLDAQSLCWFCNEAAHLLLYLQFFFYFFLAVPSFLLCLASIAVSVIATEFCWGSKCGPESTTFLVLACFGVICSVALTTMCILVIIFFMKYKRAFGILTEDDRIQEMQFRGKMLRKQQSCASNKSVL